ncbi:MAG: hypothetical protein WAW85_01860, partial [Gordonia sp. (in: high G+C Gram-positive bacteria)]|uniref:hypothetical protein n=1 Tax=Gordonia sp. (in: high G+C Gram-positive bacteria) TaxID=84139 RepID=UPI003BB79D45
MEKQWLEENWMEAFRILARHSGESWAHTNVSLYEDLEAALPGTRWVPEDRPDRPIFRRGRGPWVSLGVLEMDGGIIRLTDRGKEVLDGKVAFGDCLLEYFSNGVETNGKNVFRPILRLLADGKRHSFDEIYT